MVNVVTEGAQLESAGMGYAEGLATMLEVSKSLVASLSMEKILQTTVDGVSRLAGLGSAAVYLLEGDILHLWATSPPLPPQFPDDLRDFPIIDHPHIKKAIDTSVPVLVEDSRSTDWTPAERSAVQMRNLRTLIYLPLIAEAEVMGALIVGSVGKPSPISVERVDLCHTLANIAALAVKNSRLYRASMSYAAELEKTLIERKRSEEEREQLKEQLHQSQKMDAIGQLAGGIAHDFNNQLNGILGFAEILEHELTDERIRKFVGYIITAAERSADLTQQLLVFSRRGSTRKVEVDLHQITEEVISILERTINRRIAIKTQLAAMPCKVQGDPTLIQNALLNLALNARDAMPDGGEISFVSHVAYWDGRDCEQCQFELKPGHYIELEVSDSGCGMDAEILAHIYEPFFTTKKPGEGTGMGLSAVYGTMSQLGGAVSVDSEPGRGSTFKLFFPMQQHENSTVDESDSSSHVEIGDVDSSCEAKHVLVVDDEEIVGKVAAEHLKNAGYKVVLYKNSLDALSFFQGHSQSICLVVLDMIMPQMDGLQMFTSMKKIDPRVRCLVSSGLTTDKRVKDLLEEGARGFIQKPFRGVDLVNAVKRALEDPRNI